jgi:hypothetical protein
MNWKGFGRKQPWPNWCTTQHLPGGTKENNENPQSKNLVPWPRFEMSMYRIENVSSRPNCAVWFLLYQLMRHYMPFNVSLVFVIKISKYFSDAVFCIVTCLCDYRRGLVW